MISSGCPCRRHVALCIGSAGPHLTASAWFRCLRTKACAHPAPWRLTRLRNALAAGHLYPDPDWGELRAALSGLHGIPAERHSVRQCGSMELIACLTQAFADERRAVLAPAHAYPFFRTAAHLARARFDTAPEQDGWARFGRCPAGCRPGPDTRIVFVANPGNPTGTRISARRSCTACVMACRIRSCL